MGGRTAGRSEELGPEQSPVWWSGAGLSGRGGQECRTRDLRSLHLLSASGLCSVHVKIRRIHLRSSLTWARRCLLSASTELSPQWEGKDSSMTAASWVGVRAKSRIKRGEGDRVDGREGQA